MTAVAAPVATEVRQTVAPEVRRRQLMEAATHMFGSKGYDATRIADIVGRAGVAQGTFYLHFDSKEAIYLALTEALSSEMMAETVAAASVASNLSEALEAAIRAAFRSMVKHEAMLSLLTRSPLLATVRQTTRKLGEPTLSKMAERLRQARADGEIAADVDAEVAIRLIQGAMTHVAHYYLGAAAPARSDVETQTVAFVKRALGLRT